MDQFPGNSHKAREPDEPKKIERVTSAEAVRRKKGLGRRFKETFFQGEDARTAIGVVVEDVIIPSVKDMLSDALHAASDRIIYGESARPKRSGIISSYSNVGHVNYQGISRPSGSKPPQERSISRRSRARHEFSELVIQTRPEAEEVLDRMFDILSRYGVVSVADLYELTGLQSSHTDMKWGWTELRGARAQKTRQGGYRLDIPEPQPLG